MTDCIVQFVLQLYRSPNQTDSETMNFFEGLSDKCDDIRNKHPDSELIMVGDFNAHHKQSLRLLVIPHLNVKTPEEFIFWISDLNAVCHESACRSWN